MTDYLAGSGHLLLAAPTGYRSKYGGKTTVGCYLADGPARESELVLFVNVKGDDVVDVLEGYAEAKSIGEVAEMMGEGERRIVLTPRDSDWEAVSRRVQEFVAALPSDMSKVVLLDEAPELDDDAVLWFVRVAGNGANCKTILMTQSPTDVPGSVVKNVILVWVGPVPSSYQAWFRTHDYQTAYDYISAEHDPYHWTAVLGPDTGDWDHYEPVPEDYAP